VIESEALCLETAKAIKEITAKLKIPFIFKSSYDKANRLSGESYRGPGIKKGLEVLAKVRAKVKVPVLSDIHCRNDVEQAAEILDVIQIPAFLCRQTDIVVAAAKTGKPINIKKGQFLAPWDILPIIKKIEACGNRKIIITERGVTFGYNNLVSDFRALSIMRAFGYPVVYDATHSVQLPGGKGSSSGGQREFVEGLSRAATAFGCDGLFLEVHPDPDKAPCDGANMISLKMLEKLLGQVKKIEEAL
jgi:2-dehydro-3-deoxyphosphooctonate aldolase (KDO 8-P synthase)